jgi:hypothetical protein
MPQSCFEKRPQVHLPQESRVREPALFKSVRCQPISTGLELLRTVQRSGSLKSPPPNQVQPDWFERLVQALFLL